MIIGIDPGADGAIAFLGPKNEFLHVIDMPTMALTGKRRQVNPAELAKALRYWEKYFNQDIIRAYVEQVNAMPKQGVSSSFTFGMSYGSVLGVLAALQIPLVLVTPHKWKKTAKLIGRDKDAARTLAQQLYPRAPLGLKKNVDRADAILIARSGQID